MKQGKVYIVGAGPGDPDLITVKGKKAIEIADVIFYDRLISKDLLTYAKADAELIYCGKKPNDHAIPQDQLNQLLVETALAGKVVTRLKGGDPFIFGRGSEEAEQLAKHAIPFEIVPGISSGIAAPAYAGIPVTHRNVSNAFTVITGHDEGIEQTNWRLFAKENHTLIIYMGVKNIQKIVTHLITNGKPEQTPIAVIHWGTTNIQRYITSTLQSVVRDVASHKITNPAIIIIGDVVHFHDKINWFSQTNNELQPLKSF